ncbi:MAG: response regulator [Nitrospiraceae bacterium]
MPHILLIDDDARFVTALATALRLKNSEHRIHTASTAMEGLGLLAECDYDVVISDFRMPGLSGLTLLKECKATRPDTPVILITGYGDSELLQNAVSEGAYAFIHKPVDVDVVHSTIARALLRRQIYQRGARVQLNPPELEAQRLTQRGESLKKRMRELDDRLQQLLTKQKPGTGSGSWLITFWGNLF